MYKKKLTLLATALVMALVLAFSSCKAGKEPQKNNVFHISSASFDSHSSESKYVMSFSAEGGVAYIDFESSEPWKATCEADWFVLTPDKGTPGNMRMTLKVSENRQNTPRRGKITLEAKNETLEIVLFQQKLYQGDLEE